MDSSPDTCELPDNVQFGHSLAWAVPIGILRDEFFDEAAATEAACNWAPPTMMLDGSTQTEWHEQSRRPVSWE